MQGLPISNPSLTPQCDLFLYCGFCLRFGYNAFLNGQRGIIQLRLQHVRFAQLADEWKTTRQTISKFFNAHFNTNSEYVNLQVPNCEGLVMLPRETLQMAFNIVLTYPLKTRSALLKVFFYLYWNCNRFGGEFSHGLEQMAAELKVDRSDLSRRIKFWLDAGFFTASRYVFGEVNIARKFKMAKEHQILR